MFLVQLQIANRALGLVLHPGMCSVWFENLGTDPWKKQDEHEKAETVFCHIAQTYFNERSSTPATADQPASSSRKGHANGFLSKMLIWRTKSFTISNLREGSQQMNMTRLYGGSNMLVHFLLLHKWPVTFLLFQQPAEMVQKALLLKAWIRSRLLDVNELVKPQKKHGSAELMIQN
ncbi:hypothetical protein BT96DRAFT_945068 [Gymnopus androsaceus JB14]|uniref:Uncharacterized protein n=1 Tax=Gymnopus androsaceus JB14 TaxID=1447944 RepID=A0A6A4H1D8_9AGAR|nr:hypothetical protein BT96DRAFT_945068 [Gymnopus androsaceus JB14]